MEYIVNSPKYGEFKVLLDDDYNNLVTNSLNVYVKYHNKIKGFYAYISTKPHNQQPLHKYLMNYPKGLVVDHINHNTLDNRRCNLRVVTDTINKMNRKDNTSGFVGVDKVKSGWRAQIQYKGKKYTKVVKTLEDAIKYRKYLESKFLNVEELE